LGKKVLNPGVKGDVVALPSIYSHSFFMVCLMKPKSNEAITRQPTTPVPPETSEGITLHPAAAQPQSSEAITARPPAAAHAAPAARSRSKWALAGILGVAVLAGAGIIWWLIAPEKQATEPKERHPPLFRDVTKDTGIDFTYRNGQEAGHYAILESLGGGVALIDYDGDGLLDIFVTGGGYYTGKDKKTIKGHPCKLYKNLGGFKFKDVTREVGLADFPWFYTHGCAVADYNRDGWPDLLVTGWGRFALFRNVSNGKGGRKFIDVTKEAHLDDKAWTTSAAFMDLHGNGYPDLYLCQYVNWDVNKNNPKCPGYTPNIERDVCPPKQFQGLDHLLYRNNGDGTFTNITKEADLNIWGKMTTLDGKQDQVEVGKGLGVVAADLNNSQRPSIYVANDTVDNFLYMNRTVRGLCGARLKLEECGSDKGVARDGDGSANGSMGVDVGDYLGNSFASIFVTNYEDERHALYRNDGKEVFSYATEIAGIQAIGQRYVGFGTSFVDLENRGWLDIVIINGHVIRHPVRAGLKQEAVLFRNEAGERFKPITDQGGDYFTSEHIGRGLAVGDLDNDGRPDLVVSHVNEPVSILRNVAGDKAERNHWLGFALAGRKHRDLVGTRIVIKAGKQQQTRFVKGGGSYMSASDPRQLFGLGKETRIESVTVYWSWGGKETWDGKQFETDRYWRLVEGKKKAEPWPARSRARQ
jgi:hypothetical protein